MIDAAKGVVGSLRKHPWIVFSVCIFALLLVFRLPFIHDHFISDDFDWIQNARQNIESHHWLGAFEKPIGANFYRPLVVVSFQIDYSLFHYHPEGYRMHQLLFQLFFILGSAWMISLLAKSRSLGFAAGAFLALWPSHQEVVMWLAGRPDLYAATFIVFSVACFYKFIATTKLKWFVLSMVFGVFGFLSKETAFILPLLFLGVIFLQTGFRNWKKIVRQGLYVVPSALILGALLLIRSQILSSAFGGYVTGDQSAGLHPTLATLSKPFTSIFYLVDWRYVLGHFSNWLTVFIHRAIFSFAGHWMFTIPALVIVLGLIKWKAKNNFLLFPLTIGIAWSLIAFIPVYSISAGINDVLQFSRLFFLSSIGYALIVAGLLWPKTSLQGVWTTMRKILFALIVICFFIVARVNATPWHLASLEVKNILRQFQSQQSDLLKGDPSSLVFRRLPGEVEGEPTFYSNSITEPIFEMTKNRSLRAFIDGSQPYANSPFCASLNPQSVAFLTWDAVSQTFSRSDTTFLKDSASYNVAPIVWDFKNPLTLKLWKVAGAEARQKSDGVQLTTQANLTPVLESPQLVPFSGAAYTSLHIDFTISSSKKNYGQNVANLLWARSGEFHGGFALKYSYAFGEEVNVSIPLCQYINWDMADMVTALKITPIQNGTILLKSISLVP